MTQGHGHGQVHKPRPEKPRHERAREKAIHEKAQKPPSHGAAPQALEKAVRGQGPHGSSRHRVERQLQHEKEKRGQSTAPNRLEKAVRGHGLHRSEKRHIQEHEHKQHRGEETPNKLEKAVRRHAPPRAEQQQKQEQQKHGLHRRERTPNKLEKAVREHLLLQDKKQQQGETQFPHEKPQHSWHDLENLTDLSKLPEPVRKSMREEARMIQNSTTMRDGAKQGILYTLGEIAFDEYQKALTAPYLPVLRSFFGVDRQNSSKEESMTRESEQQKSEQQKQEQRSKETPNKLEKAVREHASQGNGQPQHVERQDSTSQANRNAHRMSLRELGSHGPEKTPHILLESFRGDFSQGSQQQQAHDKSLPSEQQRDKQAPGTLEKRSAEKPQQPHDKSQPEESRRSISTPNTLDKAVRAHQDEAQNDDPTRSHHDQTISPKEREEGPRIVIPTKGIGFQFDSAQLVPGTMEQWFTSQPEQLPTALADPAAKVTITASASRPGSDNDSLQLSQGGAGAVKHWLKDHGVQTQIEAQALGEEPAKQAGKSDRADNASDLVARIEIKAANNVEHAEQGYTKDNLGLNADLVSFRPPLEVQAYVETNFLLGAMLPIEKGHGPINQDYYAVTVDHLPQINGQTVTPEQFLNYIRTHIYDFTAHQFGTLHAYDKTEQNKWDSPNPLGAVLQWDMAPSGWGTLTGGKEDGSVVVSAWTPDHWIFSTIRTLADWEHPVSGNREFGFKQQEDGKYVYYTRGADRPTGIVDNRIKGTIFQGAHDLWTSFQKGIVDFVNSHGGTAGITSTIHEVNDWDTVRTLCHRPATKWLSEPDR